MITSMQIKNFKSWKDTGDIRVAPFTGFFGTNSSGKTSLLQMLLLMKQTAQSSDQRQVLFFGDENSLVNLATFQDVIHNHDLNKDLEIFLSWHDDTADIENVFEASDLTLHTSIHQRRDSLFVGSLEYSSGDKRITMSNWERGARRYSLEYTVPLRSPRKDEIIDNALSEKFYEIPRLLYDDQGNSYRIGIYLEKQLSKTVYLGPLRDYPHRTYVWGGDNPSDVGQRGERAIAALLSTRSESGNRIDQRIARWLKKMGLIHSFSLRPIAPGRRDYEVVVKKTSSSAEVLITDIGFGVSQLLPVLVLCYYAPQESTIIFEQPEIHLHPSVQADLADLFIEVTKERNVQIIFESHSEHLLRRLQRRIAEETLTPEQTALYFCTMDDEGISHAELLQVNEYGSITNWPDHFFGDEMGDLVAMTEAAMRRQETEGS